MATETMHTLPSPAPAILSDYFVHDGCEVVDADGPRVVTGAQTWSYALSCAFEDTLVDAQRGLADSTRFVIELDVGASSSSSRRARQSAASCCATPETTAWQT
jgi:hypothetical protein